MAGSDARPADRMRTRRLRIRAALAGGLVLGLGATATVAAWTDGEFARSTVSAATFGIQGSTDGTTWSDNPSTAPASLTFSGQVPPFVPGNAGFVRYGIRTVAGSAAGTSTFLAPALDGVGTTGAELAADTALRDALRYSVRIIPAATTCDAAVFAGAGVGTAVATDQLLTATPTGAGVTQPLAASTGSPLFYCIRLGLQADAPTGAQGGAFGITWRFEGST